METNSITMLICFNKWFFSRFNSAMSCGRPAALPAPSMNVQVELGQRRFVNPEGVNEHLFCGICADIFYKPVSTLCGHVFCHHCLYTWLGKNKFCPDCRGQAQWRDVIKCLIVQKFLDDLDVYCNFAGCEWIGPHGSLSLHSTGCICNPTNLEKSLAEGKRSRTEDLDVTALASRVASNDHSAGLISRLLNKSSSNITTFVTAAQNGLLRGGIVAPDLENEAPLQYLEELSDDSSDDCQVVG
jgi:hypothetical protein